MRLEIKTANKAIAIWFYKEPYAKAPRAFKMPNGNKVIRAFEMTGRGIAVEF